jgi:hypothetical protein
LAYQPPANSTFLSERTSHQQSAATSQQYSSLRTNQHQPSATSQPNRLKKLATAATQEMFWHKFLDVNFPCKMDVAKI